MHAWQLPFDGARQQLSGVVVGALLNDPAEWRALGEAAFQPPHKAPAVAPVLEVKPRQTLAGDGATVLVPAGEAVLQVGASLGIVIASVACRVPVAEAMRHVAGYLVAADFSLPLPGHYRPAVRLKARDGFCPIGPRIVAAAEVAEGADPDDLPVEVALDGVVVHRHRTGPRRRGVARLIADVTEFMTLGPGDLLLLGRAHGCPLARAGQQVAVTIGGVGTLRCRVAAEPQLEAQAAAGRA
ncbi:MAG: fumarylacetoacetate hydrolase family protein [Burkholderiales bacterium]|nr:fumarylacetoacetate hydrolase family protein [Burkholderiales bacterium]